MKYPRTKLGMKKRRSSAGMQFNPSNGEPCTAKYIATLRALGFRRQRAHLVRGGEGRGEGWARAS